LLLPKTDMPLRQKNAPVAEKKFRDRTTHELYRQQVCLGRMTNETLTMGRERSTTFMLYADKPSSRITPVTSSSSMMVLLMRMETCIWVSAVTL
jgi:hypothetical protein